MAATKTITVTAQVDPDTERQAEEVFRELDLTASEAIALFYQQVSLLRRLPFVEEVPNQATREAIDESRDRERLPRFDTPESLYEDLGICARSDARVSSRKTSSAPGDAARTWRS